MRTGRKETIQVHWEKWKSDYLERLANADVDHSGDLNDIVEDL